MFGADKKIKRESCSANQGASVKNFFDAPQHLYFAFKRAGNSDVIQTIQQFYRTPNLESLSFAFTNVDDGVIDSIIEFLIKEEGSTLKELNLSGNNFTDNGISRLLDAIEREKNCKLQTLCLTGNKDVTQAMLQRADAMMQRRKSSNEIIIKSTS